MAVWRLRLPVSQRPLPIDRLDSSEQLFGTMLFFDIDQARSSSISRDENIRALLDLECSKRDICTTWPECGIFGVGGSRLTGTTLRKFAGVSFGNRAPLNSVAFAARRIPAPMSTPRQPGLKGTPRSRPGENLDSGTPSDGREIGERAREGRSRKAADNALDRTPPEKRRAPVAAGASDQADKECPTCRGVGWVCENHRDRPWRATNDFSLTACGCGTGVPCQCNPGGLIPLPIPRY